MDLRLRKNAAWSKVAVLLFPLSVLISISGVLPKESLAEGLSGYLEFEYTKNNTESKDTTGRSIQSESDSFRQSYNLLLDKKVYPNLNFFASGIFQQRDSSFDGEGLKIDTTTTTRRPYVSLNLRTPLLYAEAAYTKNEEKVKVSGASPLTTEREGIIATLYWRPDGYPDLKLQYFRDNQYDKDRVSVDTVNEQYQVNSNYSPMDALTLRYQGTFRKTELQLSDTTTEQTTNKGQVNYFNSWWQRRISFGLDYNYNRQDIKTTTKGQGELGFPIFPFAGLSVLSDIPENVVLASNPALIDGNLVAGTGINLGLPPPGGDQRLRNIGLDFAAATEVNTLYVWVDRDVGQVSDAFSWRIYTSADNQNWKLHQIVFPAIYSTTFNRFEIRFANVTPRYIKVVTAPLSPTVPFASEYPIILVTELQAEIRKSASEVAGEFVSVNQIGNLSFRAVILEIPTLAYEFSYFFTKNDPGILTYIISNGLSLSHQFSRIFSGAARVSYENSEDRSGNSNTLFYTASLTAVPYQTLYHSLVISGKDEKREGINETNNSVYLYNIAKLYEGIDVNLGGGVTFIRNSIGRKSDSTQVNGGVTFVPNQKLTINLLYNGNTTTNSGGDLAGENKTYTRAGEVNLTFLPLRALYLYGSYRIEKINPQGNRNVLNYTATWSPFPDGTVHMNFYYNEFLQTTGEHERSIIPSLRWYFMQRSYLDISYQNLKTENGPLTTVSNIYSGTVRITF